MSADVEVRAAADHHDQHVSTARPRRSRARHDKHAGHDPEAFRRRFWLTLLLTIPVVASSEMVMEWFGYELDGVAWVGPVLGTFIFAWGGQPFLAGAVAEVRDRQPGMMLLISMAITVAWVASMATSLGWFDLEFWWELALLVTIMLLGHWQEMKAIGQAHGALAALAALLPDEAERVTADGAIELVPIDALAAGDRVLVRSGARVPADGRIIEGEAELDESMITGESRPVAKTVGDRVVAGTVSTDSSMRVEIDAVGEDTALAGIQRLVADAQASGSRAQVLADRFAALLFYVAAGAAAVTFAAWSLAGDMRARDRDDGDRARDRLPARARSGDPARDRALDGGRRQARHPRQGPPRARADAHRRRRAVRQDGHAHEGQSRRHRRRRCRSLGSRGARLAAAVEADSEHPLARAIVARARDDGAIPEATGFRALTGRGVEAVVDGVRYAVGGPALLRERGLTEPDDDRGA